MIEAVTRAIRSSFAVVVAVSCLHCGGRQAAPFGNGAVDAQSDVAADVAEASWTHEDFREAYVGAHCDHLERCCTESGRTYDDAACRARWSKVVDEGYPNTPNITINTAAAKACVAEWRRTTDHCGWYRDTWIEKRPYLGRCRGITNDERFHPGDPCPDGACAASPIGTAACWDDRGPDDTEPVSRCLVFVHAKLGEPCGRTGFVIRECNLAEGTHCDPISNTCQAPVPIGGACALMYGPDECTDGAHCARSKVCLAKVGLGESCADGEFACGDGTQCDREALRCISPLPLLAPCTDDFQCESFVCTTKGGPGRCVHLLSTLAGWCSPDADAGPAP